MGNIKETLSCESEGGGVGAVDALQEVNVIIVLDHLGERLLLCLRQRPPYQGKYNLVGGKKEMGEDDLAAAYRELEEETGIRPADIRLRCCGDFLYPLDRTRLTWFAGRLRAPVALQEEKNPLRWFSLEENFFDTKRFAGMGNIGHMLLELKPHWADLFERVK